MRFITLSLILCQFRKTNVQGKKKVAKDEKQKKTDAKTTEETAGTKEKKKDVKAPKTKPKQEQQKETKEETVVVAKKKIEKVKPAQAVKIQEKIADHGKNQEKGGKRKTEQTKETAQELKRQKRKSLQEETVKAESCNKAEQAAPDTSVSRSECEAGKSDSSFSEAVPLVEPENTGHSVEHPHENGNFNKIENPLEHK